MADDPILELITSVIPVDPVDGTTIVATQTIAGQAVVGPVWGHPSTVAALIRDKLLEAGRLLPSGGEVEWGWRGWSDQDPQRGMPLRDETAAREGVAEHPGTELVRRQVGPWSPVVSDSKEEKSSG